MTSVTRTSVKNETDTRRKQAFVRNMGRNPDQALLIASAIEKNVTLMSGLVAVIAEVAKHPACQKILEGVFNRPNIKKRYKDAYKVFMESALFGD